MSSIFKIWGHRRRIHLNGQYEIDLLDLKANTFCSTHFHKDKINKFIVISGRVKIESEFGSVILKENNTTKLYQIICKYLVEGYKERIS